MTRSSARPRQIYQVATHEHGDDAAENEDQRAGYRVDDDGEDGRALGSGLLGRQARAQLGIEGGDFGVHLLHQGLASTGAELIQRLSGLSATRQIDDAGHLQEFVARQPREGLNGSLTDLVIAGELGQSVEHLRRGLDALAVGQQEAGLARQHVAALGGLGVLHIQKDAPGGATQLPGRVHLLVEGRRALDQDEGRDVDQQQQGDRAGQKQEDRPAEGSFTQEPAEL